MAAATAGLVTSGLLVQALPAAADTWTSQAPPSCPTATYTVPPNTYYVQINAVGGAGRGGYTSDTGDHGGAGGAGAHVYTWVPVTPGEQLDVVVAHNGDAQDASAGFPNGGPTAYGSGKGGGASFVTRHDGDPCLGPKADLKQILVVAGGGGGGGGADLFRGGGAGGSAGNQDGSGQAGSTAYDMGLNDEGHGGGGATTTAGGAGGTGSCPLPGICGQTGVSGSFLQGGAGLDLVQDDHVSANGAGGAGGGGVYGGGGGGAGDDGGGGGGGAGSSYVIPSALFQQFTTDTTGVPSVDIHPLVTPTTTASLSGTLSGSNWYTSAVSVSLVAQAGDNPLGGTFYSLDNPACSPTNQGACQIYDGSPLSVSTSGLHTLRYFSEDSYKLDEGVHSLTFAITPTSVGVSGATITSGTDPAVTSTGSSGSVSVTGRGSGAVGAAMYASNPAGAPVFNSSGAYVDVVATGSNLTSLTITDCNLNGGTTVSWWNGTTWTLASDQVYDTTHNCVAVRVNNSTSPSLKQLTGTVLAAGSPPTATAVATTADGKPYTAGTWTNQSVTVAVSCSPNATPSAPVTLSRDGANQSAPGGSCTDGVGQKATAPSFTGIDVDKTAPTCSTTVNPGVLWAPNGKPVAITGATTGGDALSGVAHVAGTAVTSNEVMAAGDVQGFAVNSAYATPLQLSALVPETGQLKATRSGNGTGRTYTQAFTVTDQAGNTNTTPCTWTVTVPHDQAGR